MSSKKSITSLPKRFQELERSIAVIGLKYSTFVIAL